ncbi:hypothetical protein KCP77_18165 [Salmonella enterica subsp. enterica]|nr:hypothetical protein KCP77_18165 [Salmonella enterica subsp. enterica]
MPLISVTRREACDVGKLLFQQRRLFSQFSSVPSSVVRHRQASPRPPILCRFRVWRRANRFCGKAPKERVESAMAATAYLMVFMINLSQVILAYGMMFRRCDEYHGFLRKDKTE